VRLRWITWGNQENSPSSYPMAYQLVANRKISKGEEIALENPRTVQRGGSGEQEEEQEEEEQEAEEQEEEEQEETETEYEGGNDNQDERGEADEEGRKDIQENSDERGEADEEGADDEAATPETPPATDKKKRKPAGSPQEGSPDKQAGKKRESKKRRDESANIADADSPVRSAGRSVRIAAREAAKHFTAPPRSSPSKRGK